MNEPENELFEADLRRLKPAGLPEELHSRLDSPPLKTLRPSETGRQAARRRLHWSLWLRRLALPGVAVLALAAVVLQSQRGRSAAAPRGAASAPAFKADQVEIDRQWLGSFDAVANVPDGEPVRLRFQQWMDAVTLRDSVRGVEVVQRTPRIEVVPVGFATY